jgi:hypothetical protein
LYRLLMRCKRRVEPDGSPPPPSRPEVTPKRKTLGMKVAPDELLKTTGRKSRDRHGVF